MATPTPDSQGRPTFSNFTRTAMLEAEIATGVPALAMLKQTGLVPRPPAGAKILDNACGSGVVAKRLFEDLSPSGTEDFDLICGDVDGTTEKLTADLIAEKQWTNVAVKHIDAHSTGFPDGEFSHVLMNFGPQLMKDAVFALKETHRVLQSRGVAGFTCWIKAGWLPSVLETFPDFKPPGLLQTYPWKEPASIRDILKEIGFVDVEVEEHDFTTRLTEVDGFLELMVLLMPGLLNGENLEKYERHMRQEAEKAPVEMSWQALIVSARKP